ncbi:putative methyltransferase-domain-containing protein [Gorgonomyces haynaldii]|nr:putative methyltransferase-domain-containing protein [Gorgonomyces haynaldii]
MLFDLEIDGHALSVQMEPNGELGTGSTVWDCAVVLSKYFERSKPNAQSVLELGSGTGLLGLVLQHLLPEAHITLTDQEKLLKLLKTNVPGASVQELSWGNDSHLKALKKDYDLIVFSDLIAWPELYQDLVKSLEFLATSNTRIVFASERRDFEKEVEFYRLLSRSFTFRDIKPEQLDPIYQSDDIYVFEANKKR